MKKKTVFLFLFFLSVTFTLSSFNSYECDGPEPLILNYIPPVNNNNNGGGPRIPAAPIYAEHNGYSVFVSDVFGGCSVELLDSDEIIVWSGFVCDDGSFEIPASLVGIYRLKLYVNDAVFAGEIGLTQNI